MAYLHIKSFTSLVNYGSHLPVLVRCMQLTTGSVLELGLGVNSTPILHWLCATSKRELVSYEDNPIQAEQWVHYGNPERFPWHTIRVVGDWDVTEIERPWDVVLVDHSPGERRPIDIARVAPYAKYIVLHDADGRAYMKNRIREIKAMFKSVYVYDAYRPHTAVLSNFVDLSKFTV